MTTLDDKIIPYITDICKRDPKARLLQAVL